MSFPSAAILTAGHCVSAGIMPPKSADVPPWLPATAARLTSVRRGLADSSANPLPPEPPAPPGGFPAGSAYGCVTKAIEGGVAVRGQPTNPEEELAALRLGRSIPVASFICRHATMIEGRPVVALVLSHELANEREFDTYLVDMLRPVRPLICFGRAAAAPPRIEKQHAVRCWWKDRPNLNVD